MHGELREIVEVLLTSTPGDLEIQSSECSVVVKSRGRGISVIAPRNLSGCLAIVLLYLYELTGEIFKHYLACTRRLRELASYIDLALDIYVVDCDEDTRALADLAGVLIRDFNYTLERAISVSELLVLVNRESSRVRQYQEEGVGEANYALYQESLSRVTSSLRRLELEARGGEVERLLNVAGRAVRGEISGREVLERALLNEGFTRVYYASRVLGACPQSVRDVISALNDRDWSRRHTLILAPGILSVIFKKIIPAERLVSLP
ncbi:MAG: hypothetical protein ACO2OR_01965 [Desulfurococcaceae archaeon]